MSVRVSVSRTRYESWHARYDVDREVDTPWHRLLFRHLDPRRDLAGRRVLEVACGRGGLACRLAGAADPPARIVATDFSHTAVQKGSAFAIGQGVTTIHWAVGDAQALAYRDATFDTVISCETIEHLPQPCRALAELARVLRPGGRLLLTTPNYLGLLGLYRVYARLRGRPYTEEGQPINRFTMLPLTRAWIHRAGLRVITVDAIGHYLPRPGKPPVQLRGLESWHCLRWFALHSLVIAEKPDSPENTSRLAGLRLSSFVQARRSRAKTAEARRPSTGSGHPELMEGRKQP